MKKIIFLLSLINLSAYSQVTNLLLNGGFESPSGVDSPKYPTLVDNNTNWIRDFDYSDFDGFLFKCKSKKYKDLKCVEEWQSDYKYKDKAVSGECEEYYLHSPDWFKNQIYVGYGPLWAFNEPTPWPSGTKSPISAVEGVAYVGMNTAELIQQKLTGDRKFEKDVNYTLQLYFRPTGRGQIPYHDLATWTSSTSCHLKVYLRKNDAAYTIAANNLSNHCTNTYLDKTGPASSSETVLDFVIDLTSYPPGQWYPLTTTFNGPDPDFNWVVIETTEDIVNCDTYVLLDGMNISKTCDLSTCYSLQGAIVPNTNGIISTSTPFILNNLENVGDVTVKYTSASGAIVYQETHHCENGINYDIMWNGKTAGGSNVAIGVYGVKIEAKNLCGPEIKNTTLNKTHNFTGVLDPYPICNNSGVIVPKQCCSLQPDIYLDNITLPGIGLLDYIAQQNIYSSTIGPVTITNNAEVVYQAANSIVLGPGMTVESGADFHAFIAPCTEQIRSSDVFPIANSTLFVNEVDNETIIDLNTTSETNTDIATITVETITDIKISKAEEFKVVITGINTIINSIDLFNMSGKLVFRQTINNISASIDLNNYSNGIYLLRVNGDALIKNFKIKR